MKKLFPIIYMFVITALLSAVVIGFAQFTDKRVQANQKLAFEVAVLKVLPGLYDENLSSVELHNIFIENLKQPTEETAGAFYIEKDGRLTCYVLPVKGQGFWAPIEAVIGIKPDMKTVTGFAVYEQKETPGLGAEVANESFCRQFNGLETSQGNKMIYFKRPGSPLGKSEVHAVTGATQTSTRLEKIINDGLIEWRKKVK
jgi:Na(+)-translocating NADH:ubiquinone oxidoreductase C subunit